MPPRPVHLPRDASRPPRRGGFSLLEVLIAAALVLLAALAGVAFITRSAQHTEWTKDRVFARQRAVSILGELRAYVEGGEGEVAADLDGFDDGLAVDPSLTITPDPDDPGAFVAPDHPLSMNIRDQGAWRWYRRITVRRFTGLEARDLRVCTVRMFRMRHGDTFPGEKMAEVSTVIRTIGDAYPTTQVYDVYLLALENVPGWWVYMDAIKPFIEATLADLEARNPGLEFRTHWITKAGFGRDEEYAPYTNEARTSTARTPWAYVYPGRMPAGEAAERYYVAHRFGARTNLDGEDLPSFVNELEAQEPYTDDNGNGRRDPGEPYVDVNGNTVWDEGNAAPYALADMHNHGKRWPDEVAHFAARVDAGIESDDTPTWRLLLDRMVAEPERYHNAILINLHGELLPMPAVRNYSDAAKMPMRHPGWRVVTHPERLRPARVEGDDVLSDTPRFRVYAYKTRFPDPALLMTQEEPYRDLNGSGAHDAGEPLEDFNGNGEHDAGVPLSVVIRDGDFTAAPNDPVAPSIRVLRLPGGVDANGSGSPETYRAWETAPVYPEEFDDANGDGVRQVAELFFDLDGNATKDPYDPHQELDGDGAWTPATESLADRDGDGAFDPAAPAEPFTDANGNGRWDGAEPFWDLDGDGTWTPPPPATAQAPWVAWDPANYGNAFATASYLAAYGEPFRDLDGDGTWDAAEAFFDVDGDGVRDGGFERGEMWAEVFYDAPSGHTVLNLHGTPLETPQTADGRGLPDAWRLYDLDYVPCPTPNVAAGSNRFQRDLATAGDFPKNTARWIVELPLASVRRAFETTMGAGDGDAQDRILAVETRLGPDRTTGVMWPVWHEPQNLSVTYAYFYEDAGDVPFSERHQFNGDPRHSPYADTDATGTTAPHGYNWYFDNFRTAGDARAQWPAFDSGRLRARWKGRASVDVARYTSWLRTALARTEAVYTTMTGFSYYYLSIGGDVGYDSANGFPNSIPMDGRPFGLAGDVNENSIIPLGTAAIRGSLKYVRSNNGAAAGIRAGGYWWSKPWLGELFPDEAYAAQWRPWGNLHAATGVQPLEYRQFKRGAVTSAQLPRGTQLLDSYARLAAEGCTSVFNIGARWSTFHHQFRGGQTGTLVEDGPQLAENYNFPMPTTAAISRPFGLATNGSGGVGDEFDYTDAYPRFSADLARRFYDHESGTTGCGLVRLRDPSGDRAAYVVVNGLDKTLESGSAFIARYSLLSLIHGFLAAGAPAGARPVRQVPRVQILSPTIVTEIDDPDAVDVRWSVEWKRWDGLPYTASYPADFASGEADLRYVLLYSRDGGSTWLNVMDGSRADPGTLPWVEGAGPDPSRSLPDLNAGGDEVFVWNMPSDDYPEGSYLLRIEAYRASETLHYAHHREKIYVNR